MSFLISRMEAAQKAVDRYYDKPFSWGKRDCAHLAATVLVELGHPDPLADIRHYSTLLGAKRAMRKAGIRDFAEHLDKLGFERIPPASALQGDIVGFPGQHNMLALGISLGQDRVLGFANGFGAWAPTSVCTHAWRVTPFNGAGAR